MINDLCSYISEFGKRYQLVSGQRCGVNYHSIPSTSRLLIREFGGMEDFLDVQLPQSEVCLAKQFGIGSFGMLALQ